MAKRDAKNNKNNSPDKWGMRGIFNRLLKKSILTKKIVIPAKAGIQNILKILDSRFHGNDDQMRENSFSTACQVKTKTVLAFIFFLYSVFFTLDSAFAFCYEEAGLEYNINPVLLQVISKTESNLNQTAINTNPNGTQDIGLMQINSSWVKSLNLDADLLLSDPCYNLKTGAEILSKCIEQYGYRWEAIGCYNAASKDKRVKYSWKIFKELVTSNELRVTSYNKIGKKDAPAKNTKFYFKVKDKLNNYEKDSSLVTNDSLLSLEAQ